MNLLCNIIICVHLALITLVMLGHAITRIDRKSLPDKLFVALLLAALFMLILEPLSRLDGTSRWFFPICNRTVNFILFIINPAAPSLWLLFVLSWIQGGRNLVRAALVLISLLGAANLALTIASVHTGWYYTIGPDNVYLRGPYYLISISMMLVPITMACAAIVANRSRLERRVFIPMLIFPVPPLIGILLQICFFGFPFMLNSLVVSLLVLLLYVQDRSIYSDSLTGIGNRRQMYAVLSDKIKRSSPGRAFAVVMLDIDGFKCINDRCGHMIGDAVLSAAAQMLKGSVRSKDYVIRYGGDEFLLVLDVDDEAQLRAVLDRIELNRGKLNQSAKFEMEILFSIGSVLYQHAQALNVDELINLADQRMYVDKRRKG